MNTGYSQAYQDALDYIYSFVDYSRTRQETLRPENFDLSRMFDFMDLLGSPQEKYPTVHIAGTKGKGSVSALCASVLQQAGYRTGLYISPHLRDFEERMQINQQPIPREVLASYVEEIKPLVAQVEGLTTFEIMTGLAFLYYARQEVDIAVIEVGLGGRLDATNVITPLISVITSLYLDHISILGDTLEQIAFEKGGIIKPGVPVVSAPQEQRALEVLQEIAQENQSRLVEISQAYPYQHSARSLQGQDFTIQLQGDQPPVEFSIPLLGDFQVVNAVTAYAVLDLLREQGFSLPEEVIKAGFAAVQWPARIEILQEEPPVIVDSAHNPASIRKLVETINDFFPHKDLVLVFGISEDKQLDDMLEEILPRTTTLITTQADHPRAMDPEELAQKAAKFDCKVEVVPVVREALELGLRLSGENDLLVVAGSIFVAASARIAWFERH